MKRNPKIDAADTPRVVTLPETALPRGAQPEKAWRARRDLVIRLAHQHGFSQRSLADVFGLPRSRIARIVEVERADESRVRVRNARRAARDLEG